MRSAIAPDDGGMTDTAQADQQQAETFLNDEEKAAIAASQEELFSGPVDERIDNEKSEQVDDNDQVNKTNDTDDGDEKHSAGADSAETNAGEGDPEPPEWLDEEASELAQSYGFTQKEVTQFGSLEELLRAGNMLDQRLYQRGQQQTEAGEETQQQEQTTNEETATQQQEQTTEKPEEFKLDEDLHDPEIISAFDYLKGELTTLKAERDQERQFYAEQQHNAFVDQFHTLSDSIDAELFGDGSQAESDAQNKNRERLYDAAETLMIGSAVNGKQPPISKAILKRAFSMEFPDHIAQNHRRQLNEKLQKRGQQKLGTGSSRAKHQGEWDGDIADNPELLEEYARLEKESDMA